ncbi:phosphodiester glycosidase family protein [Paenibacillus sp. N4]|uniref:phosphodiester glycosidase family protein n=1 Tax=Paenibacillus vietnamensis TaxID=2590547 RepID=UPI001CD0DDE3|nr:phosphodiester glycosidase family protein [Paenibacillus vietnamensis]MCA0754145.1 phosphodiester glycosidase family protein [Paenibacillus vietnamensis]
MVTSKTDSAKAGKKRALLAGGIFLGILLVLGVLFYLMVLALANRTPDDRGLLEQTLNYKYSSETASNGMKLHALLTKPSHVTLETINDNVTLTGKTGVNGGFFYGSQLLSIGVVNGMPINREAGEYGSGGENVKYARGTLVWDGASDSLSVQVVRHAAELKVKDHTRFWAQGGISMSLKDDREWERKAAEEMAPFPDDKRLRSAAVYDDMGGLYLVVSETKGTLAEFREALIEKIGAGTLVDGIFLDGDGSSQLLSKEAALPGDSRPVVQMLRIVK